MGNLSEYFGSNYKQEEFERKQRLLSEIKTKRNQYERLLVEFLHEFVLEGKPLMDTYRIGYEELLEITKGEKPPSSLSVFEYLVFSEDDLPYDESYENLH